MINTSVKCNPNNYGSRRSIDNIQYIVIHYTGNNNDRAISNCKYFQSPNRNASAHYFVDESSIYQSVEDNVIAWSVGGKKYPSCITTGGGKWYGKCTNNNSISIEMCNCVDSVPIKTRENVKYLVNVLMKKYNIPVENIIRHFDVVGKNCPAPLLNGTEWKEFKEHIVEDKTIPEWQENSIKEVCSRYSLDTKQWLDKATQNITVGEMFAILNKIKA